MHTIRVILRGQLSNEVLEHTKTALVQGDSQQADQLFKQVEEQGETVNKVTVEGTDKKI